MNRPLGQPIAPGFLGAAALDEPCFQERIQQIHGALFGDPKALANFLRCHRPTVLQQLEQLLLPWT